jgi:hypothetical protein
MQDNFKRTAQARMVDSKGGYSKTNQSKDLGGLLSNIRDGVSPFCYQSGDVDAKDAIELCQKAYWNVSIFKLTIDIMSEFANSKIHFKSKNKASSEFFEQWFKKINGWKLGDQFFRELFRSSNVFLFRVKGDITKIGSKFPKSIPLRYILLNPADIKCSSAASFIDGSYKKILNDFESKILQKSTDPKNIELKKSLPEKVQKDIEKGISTSIPLSPDDLIPIFFKKQDYEPLAIPMCFPVLFDINLKLEFKKAEQIIARACEYMILLITNGDKDNGTDQEVIDNIEELFKKESVGRVLVSDWTTKMDFIMPDLQKILGPAKYEAVNQDIANGLMNIFFGEQKYAESATKIKVFLERLKEARKTFLNEFLIPEMESISKIMGFREIPVPEFEEVDLKDEIEYMKLYNRMYELGILTPDTTIQAYKTHILPEPYENLIDQENFKPKKDKGLFEPVGQKPNDQSGRPTGTPQKQKKKKVTPVGGSFSALKLTEAAKATDSLIKSVSDKVKEKFNLERISKKNKDYAKSLAFTITQNEPMELWEKKIVDYMENPQKIGPIFDEVLMISEEHGITLDSAALLFASKETSQS